MKLPHGEVLATYRTHEDARAAVQFLAQHEFAVTSLTIVGSDVKLVEPVSGVLSWASAAGRGALGGAWLGMIFGLIMSLFSSDGELTSQVLLPGIIIGAGLGIMYGVLLRASSSKTGLGTTRAPQVVASKYEIVCPANLLSEAKALLAKR